MKIFYRISDGSYPKVRFENATKRNCLVNFLDNFMYYPGMTADDMLMVIADNVKDETVQWLTELLKEYKWQGFKDLQKMIQTNSGSSAASFRIVLGEALKLDDDEVVYFVEDDYAHLPNSRVVLLEGLEKSHYVTLYNHPDKYISANQGGNPLIGEDGAEETRVFVTDSSYWMLTNSTTMTFATTVKTLREDEDVWLKFTEGTYPQDMNIFLELRKKERTLIQPIPTMATHCEPEWAAHLHGTNIGSWDLLLDMKATVRKTMERHGEIEPKMASF